MKKLLATTALLAALATMPAYAWEVMPKKFFFVNNTIHWTPDLDVERIILKSPGHTFTVKLATDVGPGQQGTFGFFKGPPCLWWVTLDSEYRPNLTAPNQFNVCTQSKITVFQADATGRVGFTFN